MWHRVVFSPLVGFVILYIGNAQNKDLARIAPSHQLGVCTGPRLCYKAKGQRALMRRFTTNMITIEIL